ncbi:hypothetical protein [Pedosphaera parvula]|uniref:Uncharacterized protein n=1 Tax=Pedosphaera parvula (strain Ellin514) TaxID=320771 RepID=B9XH87_PEDPL|nr:hypothetical protein [Pedosphaera parvula]EEF60722.1 hypothetical protein Cflav_PD3580 [Pedosphaera parvula Ellin514]
MHFRTFKILTSCTVFASITLLALPATADVLQLTNGDHYSGTVISMTTSNLQFQSEIQGLVKIPRDKVANITLRPLALPAQARSATVQPATPNALAATPPSVLGVPTLSASNSNASSAAGIVKQLKAQGGVDKNTVDDLQKQLMGSSSPEVTKMFNEMVGGLMNGKLSVNDIRTQARSSIAQIQAAKKDLGGDPDTSEVLDGYVGILEKFLSESGSSDPTPAAKPAPTK